MEKIVKGENLKNSAEEVLQETLKDNVIDLPKEKAYYVVTDDDGNIKGYFPLKNNRFGKD